MTFGPYAATVVAIHDGDTFDVNIVLAKAGRQKADTDLGFNVHRGPAGVVLERQSVRLYGCNAPELATTAGKQALAFIESVLHVGDVVSLLSHGWDKYGGRIDGEVTLADGRDLAAVMIAAGQAAPWDGKGVKPVPAPVRVRCPDCGFVKPLPVFVPMTSCPCGWQEVDMPTKVTGADGRVIHDNLSDGDATDVARKVHGATGEVVTLTPYRFNGAEYVLDHEGARTIGAAAEEAAPEAAPDPVEAPPAPEKPKRAPAKKPKPGAPSATSTKKKAEKKK